MFRSAIISLHLLMTAQYLICQDIYFPEDDETYVYVSDSRSMTERKSPKVLDSCPDNMYLYKVDGTWVCECKLRYIHFPKDDTCHEAFYRGPCPKHHYVYLAPNETIPKCMKNVCRFEGLVYYKGLCHTLKTKGGPCGENGTLSVNDITYQLECINRDNEPFVITSLIEAPQRSCPKGSRRNNLGMCKMVV